MSAMKLMFVVIVVSFVLLALLDTVRMATFKAGEANANGVCKIVCLKPGETK
jgi:hypothetical protein